MPDHTMRPCSYPGCTVLVKRGRCLEHQVVETYFRDPDRQRLYGREWRQRRQVWLPGHPWCEECIASGLFTPAEDVHHVEPHLGDVQVFNSSPLMSLCHACHSKVTNREKGTHHRRGVNNV